ncbi:MAG TPA: hypothetical protein VEU94_09145 [Terriglobales bacterium]|nr:hypothetical protein [Terriglobales bacterium]
MRTFGYRRKDTGGKFWWRHGGHELVYAVSRGTAEDHADHDWVAVEAELLYGHFTSDSNN